MREFPRSSSLRKELGNCRTASVPARFIVCAKHRYRAHACSRRKIEAPLAHGCSVTLGTYVQFRSHPHHTGANAKNTQAKFGRP